MSINSTQYKFAGIKNFSYICQMKTFIDWLKHIRKPKWECYEIHVVQARMYGCTTQCEACKNKQDEEKQKTKE